MHIMRAELDDELRELRRMGFGFGPDDYDY
jgi:hypothetical protein